jgi:hypothetical protein
MFLSYALLLLPDFLLIFVGFCAVPLHRAESPGLERHRAPGLLRCSFRCCCSLAIVRSPAEPVAASLTPGAERPGRWSAAGFAAGRWRCACCRAWTRGCMRQRRADRVPLQLLIVALALAERHLARSGAWAAIA